MHAKACLTGSKKETKYSPKIAQKYYTNSQYQPHPRDVIHAMLFVPCSFFLTFVDTCN